MENTVSDALTIARWCWRARQWSLSPDNRVRTSPDIGSPACFDPSMMDGHVSEFETEYGVSSAEAVLIERGLAEEYGNAICVELCVEGRGKDLGTQCAMIATAPLAARVCALAAVIRAQEAKHG